MKRLVLALALIVMVVFAVWFYLLPRWTGDQFVDRLIHLDPEGMESTLCAESNLDEVRGALSAAGGDVAQWIISGISTGIPQGVQSAVTDSLQPEAVYNPFTGLYSFKLVFEGDVSLLGFGVGGAVESPQMTITIYHQGLGGCVASR